MSSRQCLWLLQDAMLEEGLSGRESLMLELDSIPDAHQVEAIMLLAKFPSLVSRD